MSRFVLRESDNMADTSLDDELDNETLSHQSMSIVTNSKKKVDKRLVAAYKARKADEVDKRNKPRP